MNKLLTILLILFVLSQCRKQKKEPERPSLYNEKKSYVTPITALNFEGQVNKIRQTTQQVSIIHFYKPNDGVSEEFAPKFDKFCDEYRGIFRIGYSDCSSQSKICEKERITEFPTVRIYPPQPMPAFDIEGELEIKKIIGKAAQQLSSNVIEVTSANADTWIKENPAVPKVLLFTDKKGTPLIYKALSVNFQNKLFFGIVRLDEEILKKKYKVTKYPTILVVKSSEKKPKYYEGEMKFQPIFEFLNIFSEVFVPGGGSSADTAASKSWLTEIVPEFHQKSAQDICLKKEGVLCVIAVSKGKPDKDLIDTLKQLNEQYDRKIDRGLAYKFMWLDADQEQKWAELLKFEGETSIVLLNPGKRKRIMVHEGDTSKSSLAATFEKVVSGEARFKALKGDLDCFNTLRKDI